MISTKTLLIQLALFAAVAFALPANVPAITPMDCQPEAPLLPTTFTGAFSERLTINGADMWVEGYYYYSDLVEAVQIDYALPGAIGSNMVAGGEFVVSQVANGEYFCSSSDYPLPFLAPDVLQGFDFLGASVSPLGELLYAWGQDVFGFSLVVMTNAETGALAAEYTDNMVLTWQSFEEGIPDNVFMASCDQTHATKSTVAEAITFPRSFVAGNL